MNPSLSQRERHRLSQAKYRARKENRILELQQQLETLQRLDSFDMTSVSECTDCPFQTAKLEESMRVLRGLEAHVVALQGEKEALLRQVDHSQTPDSLDDYGIPLPSPGIIADAEVMRAEMQRLPSLRYRQHDIDKLIHIRMEFDTLTDDQSRRIQFLRFEKTKFNLMDACTLLERKRIIEIIEWFRSRHRAAVSPVEEHSVPIPAQAALPAMIRTDLSLSDDMKRIPSLQGAWEVIDRWTEERASWRGLSGNRTQRETQDYILRHNDYVRALAKLCVGDELIQFYLALEVGRTANKHIWDVLYDEALYGTCE
ncbi:hypothetical protein HDU98_007463 [Podochytrium sp. JEL0797]|nr:hypothetical protein HDU98_007463 [Podochytrium sp. JEL0797]